MSPQKAVDAMGTCRCQITAPQQQGGLPFKCENRVSSHDGPASRCSPSFLIVNGGSHAERESPRQSRPRSLGQSALPSRGPPCTPGTWSPTALSSQFAPPTWVRPSTTFGGRAAASSHAWIARHQPCAQAHLKLIEHESTPWRTQWMKVRMPTPLNHTSTMASIGESNLALHIARNPVPPFNRSTCRRADGSR